MGSFLQLVAAVATWLFGLITGKNKKTDDRKAVVNEVNESNQHSADIARQTEKAIDHEEAENGARTDSDRARVRDSDSMQDGATSVDDAISQANDRLRKR